MQPSFRIEKCRVTVTISKSMLKTFNGFDAGDPDPGTDITVTESHCPDACQLFMTNNQTESCTRYILCNERN